MREVHDAHHAEDQREAAGDKEEQGGKRQAVEDLEGKELGRHESPVPGGGDAVRLV